MIYPAGCLLTGQQFASELLMDIFTHSGIHPVIIKTPALNRTTGGLFAKPAWLFRMLKGWFLCLMQLPFPSHLHLNIGQTYLGFLREGAPYLLLALRNRKKVSVISLHGAVFLEWERNDLACKIFLIFVRYSNFVTCLGQQQKDHLIQLGVPEKKIRILYNAVRDAQGSQPNTSNTVQVLYLSNLIQTKGYDNFLKALALITERVNRKVNVVLAGKPLDDGSGTFGSNSEAIAWIEEMISNINASDQVSIEWIKGIYGEEKDNLFNHSSIFVFPTRYRVEAQPIVLLEAMAAGCAVITTREGEIPEALGDSAVYADGYDVCDLADKILEMINNDQQREYYADQARKRFESYFSFRKHTKSWGKIYDFITKKEST